MTQDLSRLVREIERIVTAPYVPSLQDLYALVQTDASLKVCYWTTQKPCQIGLLADILVDGLSRSRMALPLLGTFASEVAFRDALFSRYPTILEAFIEKAVGTGDSEYVTACIILLSQPLPSGFVPPIRIADLITRLVSQVSERPCAETIAPLHHVMNGLQGCALVHYEIPLEVMGSMQLEFTKTLRNLDDHLGNLLCLATFARLSVPRHQEHNNQHGPEPPSWLLNIRQFFGNKRGLKTLDLVVLRVILACSANCNNLTPPQAAESIRLAICIADAIEPDQKQAWVSGNHSKIAKLCEKVVRDGLDQEIQMMGVAFILCIFPKYELPSHIRELGVHALLSKGSRGVMGAMPHHLIPRLAESLAQTDESAVYHLLRLVFETVQNDALPDRNSLSDLKLAQMILLGFQSSNSQYVSSAIMDSVSTKQSIAALLEGFPAVASQTQCEGLNTCHHTITALKNEVLSALFDTYFAAELSRGGNDQGVTIMKSFVHRSAKLLTGGTCQFSHSSAIDFQSRASLNISQGTTSSEHTRDWRSSLTDSFRQNAQISHESMMRKVEEVCFDLERRCYDVEGPLRSAEEQRDLKILETEEVQRQKLELEEKLQQSNQMIAEMKQEMVDMEENRESTSTREQELSSSLESVMQELDAQKQATEKEIQQEKEEARTRELDLIAASTTKDEHIEELQEEVHRLQSENDRMIRALDNASVEQAASIEKSATLRQELSDFREKFEENITLCGQKEDEVKRLLADSEDIRMELGTAKAMVEEQTHEAERLHSTLQELESKSKLELKAMRDRHETESSQLHMELNNQKEQNGHLRLAIQEAAANTTSELQSKEKRIVQLERKIQSLRDERAAKAREFSEAQQHIGRLMNVMGFVPKKEDPAAPAKGNRVKTANRRDIETQAEPTYDEDDTQLAESFDSMGFDHRERSPKRPRGNHRQAHPSQLLPPKTPASLTSKPKARGAETLKASSPRKPLEEINSNSPTKSALSELKKAQNSVENSQEPGANHLQNIDLSMDLEFTQDFIFTSTALSGSNGQSAQQEQYP